MLTQPRIKAHYVVEVVGSGNDAKVFLLAEGRHHIISGSAAAAVVGLLDGRQTVPAIIAGLGNQVPMMAAFSAIQMFEAGGHCAEGRPELDEEALAYWDMQDINPAGAIAKLKEFTISLVALGNVDAPGTAAALATAGLQVEQVQVSAAASITGGITLVLTDDYLHPGLMDLNDSYLASGQRWLLGKPTGRQLWVGPLITPGASGCWSCLEQRLAGNRQVERYVVGKHGGTSPVHPHKGTNPASGQLFAGLLGTELLRTLTQGAPARLDGQLVSIDTRTLEMEDHVLVRQPQCNSCGDSTLITQRSGKIAVSSRVAMHTTDGGHRVQPPHLTYDRMKKHISPILGAITTLSAHEGDDNGITYSFTAGHNFAMVNDNIDLLRRNLRGQSGGKGRTEIQAKVSAVCEAVERYSAVWRGDEPVTKAAYQDLDPEVAVHPDQLLRFSAAQVADRKSWNADPSHRIHLVPEAFQQDLVLDWSTAWSLTHDAERLIPAGLAWYGHPDLARHFYCVGDSNGSASGNTLEEAILQGFCELTERDAVAIWWYNRIPRRAFDLDSLNDPYTKTLEKFYDEMDRDIWVLDITSDLGIPTFAAVSARRHDVEDIMVGFGSHPDARTAVFRSLTEVNQFLPFVDQRDEHGCTIYRTDDLETLAWCKEVKIAQEPWLQPSGAQKATTADFFPLDGHDLADHIRVCVDRANEAGIEVMAIDQSRPDLDLAVVKVFAPGMRHFWRRLGAGRLYDVPVAQGWLQHPTAEAQMNPRNVFF